jgi:predicted outer membrane protein
MHRLAPFRGSLFRLAFTLAASCGIVAVAFVMTENSLRSGRGLAGRTASYETAVSPSAGEKSLGSGELTLSDQRFVRRALALSNETIVLSESAATQASAPDVQEIASELIAEQKRAREELTGWAANAGLADLKNAPATKADAKSITAEGSDFSKKYLDRIAALQNDARDLFARTAGTADDPELRAFARHELPKAEMWAARVKAAQRNRH